MKKIKYYKKAIHNFVIYMIALGIISILLMPIYSSLYESLRQEAIVSVNNNVHKEVSIMENEINIQKNMLKKHYFG